MFKIVAALSLAAAVHGAAQTQPVAIHFKGSVGAEDFSCGQSYKGIGSNEVHDQPHRFPPLHS